MTKTICDRCGKDIHFLPYCIETNIFLTRHEADLCKECYQELLEWLKEKKMSLNKAIEHHKEHRKPYRGGKSVDKQCRNHGGCEWCLDNRTHKYEKQKQKADWRD